MDNKSQGIGFFGLLTILFIGLKLTGHIDWAWIWVLAPAWCGCGCIGVLLIIVLLVALIAKAVDKW